MNLLRLLKTAGGYRRIIDFRSLTAKGNSDQSIAPLRTDAFAF